jgi:hypothetical protein
VALPVGVVDQASLLAYAVSHGSAAYVAEVLTEAATATVPCTETARILLHLQLMTAGDRVRRLADFIRRAAAHIVAKRRQHTWAEIMDLVDQFVADGRHNNDPATVNGGGQISVGACRCTGERIGYFVKAHTYGYFDFTIVNRSRDDITLFPPGMNVAAMRLLVGNVFGQVDAQTIADAAESNKLEISNVDCGGQEYEIGLVAQGTGGNVALIHFMPFTVDPADFWHKDLLQAVGRLF